MELVKECEENWILLALDVVTSEQGNEMCAIKVWKFIDH